MLTLVDQALEDYALAHTTPPGPLFEQLRERTYAEMKLPQMQVGAIEGQLLKTLVQLLGARVVVEVGMFTGYSALMMAEGLPDDGRLYTCDIDPKAEAVAREFFGQSPHGHKIEVRMGPAIDTLAALEGPFDLVFLDADKERYSDYYDAALPKLRPGGLIVADNVLWSGSVVNPDATEASTRGLQAFSAKVRADPRVEVVMLTVRDGISLIRKR